MNALKLRVFALATMLAAPAMASHTEQHPSGWFEYQYDEHDESVLYCNALGEVRLGNDFYLHDRKGVEQTNGIVDENGGGTWIFQESNDIPGLQIGGAGIYPDTPPPTGDWPDWAWFPPGDPFGPAGTDPYDGSSFHPGCPWSDTPIFGNEDAPHAGCRYISDVLCL